MNRYHLILLFALVIFTYIPSLFGGFIWDDEDFVYQNRYVATFDIGNMWTQQAIAGRGKSSNYYRPVQLTTYALIHRVVGYWPSAYHGVNIAFHALAAILVYAMLRGLTGSRWVSLAASAVFAVHPVQTEAVTYISGLSDPLVVSFGSASVLAYLHKHRHPFYLLGSLVLYILALLSKEIGIVFGAIIFTHALLFHRKHILIIVTLFSSVTIGYLLYHWGVISVAPTRAFWPDTPYADSAVIRIATFTRSFFTYLSLLIFPAVLHMERDPTVVIEQSLFNPYAVLLITLIVITVALIVKRFRSRTERMKVLFLFGAFFLSLAPYSGIVLINGLMYEHFLYVPMMFFFAFLFMFIPRQYRAVTTAVLVLVIALSIARSWIRQYEWIDPVRFYTQTLQHAPMSLRVRNNLGMEYAHRGQYEQAITQYNTVLSSNRRLAPTHHNLANALRAIGRYGEAIDHYRLAIESDPDLTPAYAALIETYELADQPQDAQSLREMFDEQFRR